MRRPVRALTIVAIALLATWTAIAAGRKVMVLPIEGDADAAQRTKLTASLLKVTRANGGDVSSGTTTFGEIAVAVGCDPTAPACGDTVLATLKVDEVVFGTASSANGQTTVVVTRIAKGQPRRDQTLVVTATDGPDKTEGDLKNLWSPALAPGSGSGSGWSGSAVGSDVGGSGATVGSAAVGSGAEGESFFDTRDRKLGFGFIGGGAVALVVGLALWSSESSVQSQINSAPNMTATDIQRLRDLEDRASAYAWEGNVLVGLGLVAGGVGAYFLWTDHKARTSATVVPIDHGTGAAVVVGGRW